MCEGEHAAVLAIVCLVVWGGALGRRGGRKKGGVAEDNERGIIEGSGYGEGG